MIHADTEGLLDRCKCGAVAGNIRLIEEAPRMFDVLLKAHDLSLDGHHEEARSLMRDAIDAVEQERLPDTY